MLVGGIRGAVTAGITMAGNKIAVELTGNDKVIRRSQTTSWRKRGERRSKGSRRQSERRKRRRKILGTRGGRVDVIFCSFRGTFSSMAFTIVSCKIKCHFLALEFHFPCSIPPLSNLTNVGVVHRNLALCDRCNFVTYLLYQGHLLFGQKKGLV